MISNVFTNTNASLSTVVNLIHIAARPISGAGWILCLLEEIFFKPVYSAGLWFASL